MSIEFISIVDRLPDIGHRVLGYWKTRDKDEEGVNLSTYTDHFQDCMISHKVIYKDHEEIIWENGSPTHWSELPKMEI